MAHSYDASNRLPGETDEMMEGCPSYWVPDSKDEEAEEEPELDARQMEAAGLVAGGTGSLAEVAEAVGVDRKTLFRWRQMPLFFEEVERLTRESLDAAEQLMKVSAGTAAARLVQGLSEPGINGLRAAREILDRVRDGTTRRRWRTR